MLRVSTLSDGSWVRELKQIHTLTQSVSSCGFKHSNEHGPRFSLAAVWSLFFLWQLCPVWTEKEDGEVSHLKKSMLKSSESCRAAVNSSRLARDALRLIATSSGEMNLA